MPENPSKQTTHKWWEPTPRDRPLFDWYDIAHWFMFGIVLGITFCTVVNKGWLG